MPDLILDNVTKKFQQIIAVNHVSLMIPTGQFVAFLGPNGAGKSTTISMLTGLLAPTSGRIQLGKLIPQQAAYREQLGVVFQNSVLDPKLTVQQNLTLRAALYRHHETAWLEHLMTLFALIPIRHQRYDTLSGGQRRRVDIVRALLHRPTLLLLDEPTTGLDLQSRTAIWTALATLRNREKLTVILTTHYLEEAETADWVYVIDHGCVVASDTVTALKQHYAHYQLTLQSPDLPQLTYDLQRAGYITRLTATATLQVSVNNAQQGIDVLHTYQHQISNFEGRNGDMNDVFLALTGKDVR